MLIPVVEYLLRFGVTCAEVVARHLREFEPFRDRLPLEMTRSTILRDRVTRELLPLVLSFRRVTHRISDEFGVIACCNDEDKFVWMDVKHWWSWLFLLVHPEVLDLVSVFYGRNVLVHVLLYLCVGTEFLWLSEIWEAWVHLEMKLNLIRTTELLLQVIAQMRPDRHLLVMRDEVVRILSSSIALFPGLTALS